MWRTSNEIAGESRANWSKQVHTNVTFILDHADDFLDSNCRKQFLNLLRTVRMLSEQRVTYVITTRKTFKDSELQTGEVRLNPLITRRVKKYSCLSRVRQRGPKKAEQDKGNSRAMWFCSFGTLCCWILAFRFSRRKAC